MAELSVVKCQVQLVGIGLIHNPGISALIFYLCFEGQVILGIISLLELTTA